MPIWTTTHVRRDCFPESRFYHDLMKNSQLGQLLLWIAQYSSDMPGLGRRVLFLLQYVPRYPQPYARTRASSVS